MELVVAKIIALVLLGLVSILIGFLPVTLRRWIDTSPGAGRNWSWKNTLVSFLLCFGGGVIMATSLVHILPEVRKNCDFSLSGLEILFNLMILRS
jgi:zinc transporter 1/2/3